MNVVNPAVAVNPAIIAQNALLLANAAALTYAIIMDIGENNIARSINGESLTRSRIEMIVTMKLSDAFQSTAISA